MKRGLKLGTQLNISFALVLFVPMIIATVFSIVYYSQKIREEAVNTISSDLKIASIIYENAEADMGNIASAYAQKKIINFLIVYNLGEKIGQDWARSAVFDGIDMITVVDTAYTVLVRSHAPRRTGDTLPRKPYIDLAFSGTPVSGTEVLSLAELEHEGFTIDPDEPEQTDRVLAMTGTAPVYDRQRENIVGAIIIRRILNRRPEIVDSIIQNLAVNAALFEHTRLIASASSEAAGTFVPPPETMLNMALTTNTTAHTADISRGGSIAKYMPIDSFDGQPVGVLMVQTGVGNYVRTRNIAIITLLIIFFTGMLLAFSIKTIIERRIVTPVRRLQKGVERVGSGDYAHQLEVTTHDEIGELTGAFNAMARDLHEYDRQLKEYNQQLETRVQERTAELRIANEQLIKANTVLEDTLERLNPGVSRLIGNNRQQLGLVYATELVADVCNYTKLNMILGETMMGEFMKKFFREGHKLLAQYRGMFDKTVGDQIVAIFGTPKDEAPASMIHAFDAVACALKLVEAANAINRLMQAAIQDNYSAIAARHQSLSKEDREGIRIEDLRFQCRIGINTSNPTSDREIDRMRMVMMGAETCVDYTAQGGAIIYAFRLESSGRPGEIHIGENSRRLVEHVFRLEEMPAITLKGLGTQPRYQVLGCQPMFSNLYPRTRLYQTYCNRIPLRLTELIQDLRLGKIQIREVRKINDALAVDIPYLEHLAGVYNQCLSRALFTFALAEELALEPERRDAVLFASVWQNAMLLQRQALESMLPCPVREQIPGDMDAERIEAILAALDSGEKGDRDADLITLCNQYDQMVYDRSYLRSRSQDTVSAKEMISIVKIEDRFDTELVHALERLVIAPEVETEEGMPTVVQEWPDLPDDPDILATVLRQRLSDEDRLRLVARLNRTFRQEMPEPQEEHSGKEENDTVALV